MWARVRTILVVTLVTCLIWIWADAETQKDDLLRPGDTAVTDDSQMTVASVPVMIAMPASAKSKWPSVTPDTKELKHITVVGPRAMIDRLKDNDADVHLAAVLVINEQELRAGGVVSKSVELSPAGAGLRFVGPVPTVHVTIGQ